MPLKCLDANNRPVYAFDFSAEEFDALRRAQRKESLLHFACCDSKLALRTSSKGLQHFYHASPGVEGGCTYSTESEAHLKLKQEVMLAARAAQWEADCEVGDEGGRWRADVLMRRGKARIAMEIQLSKLPWYEIQRRQAAYAEAGVRGLWLLRQDNYPVCHEVPAFQLRLTEDTADIRITPPNDYLNVSMRKFEGYWEPLSRFVAAALSKNLVWSPVSELRRVDIRLRVVEHHRCDCGRPLLLPTSLAISMPYLRYRGLLWSVLPGEPSTPNPGPAWLNAVVDVFNRHFPQKNSAVITRRVTQGRAHHVHSVPAAVSAPSTNRRAMMKRCCSALTFHWTNYPRRNPGQPNGSSLISGGCAYQQTRSCRKQRRQGN
ncbi:competence protein CoiA [Caballeronia grimmiae]|uniref:competence protein CoiA n=1 Tax=Caballeronia grimmiae TaxID=1071679 RepID=UPI0038B882FD